MTYQAKTHSMKDSSFERLIAEYFFLGGGWTHGVRYLSPASAFFYQGRHLSRIPDDLFPEMGQDVDGEGQRRQDEHHWSDLEHMSFPAC